MTPDPRLITALNTDPTDAEKSEAHAYLLEWTPWPIDMMPVESLECLAGVLAAHRVAAARQAIEWTLQFCADQVEGFQMSDRVVAAVMVNRIRQHLNAHDAAMKEKEEKRIQATPFERELLDEIDRLKTVLAAERARNERLRKLLRWSNEVMALDTTCHIGSSLDRQIAAAIADTGEAKEKP